MDGFASCLTLKGLHLFAALDTTMPTDYPELNEDEDDKESLELVTVLNLQWKVTNKYEFAAKPAEATWSRNLLKDLGFKLNPAVVYEDNAAAISIATRART